MSEGLIFIFFLIELAMVGELGHFKDCIMFKFCYHSNFKLHRREVCVAVEVGRNNIFSILGPVL